VLQMLRRAGNEPLPLVRALAHLERHPAILVVSREASEQRAPAASPAGGALRRAPVGAERAPCQPGHARAAR
jgi:hypothetical protein